MRSCFRAVQFLQSRPNYFKLSESALPGAGLSATCLVRKGQWIGIIVSAMQCAGGTDQPTFLHTFLPLSVFHSTSYFHSLLLSNACLARLAGLPIM